MTPLIAILFPPLVFIQDTIFTTIMRVTFERKLTQVGIFGWKPADLPLAYFESNADLYVARSRFIFFDAISTCLHYLANDNWFENLISKLIFFSIYYYESIQKS